MTRPISHFSLSVVARWFCALLDTVQKPLHSSVEPGCAAGVVFMPVGAIKIFSKAGKLAGFFGCVMIKAAKLVGVEFDNGNGVPVGLGNGVPGKGAPKVVGNVAYFAGGFHGC